MQAWPLRASRRNHDAGRLPDSPRLRLQARQRWPRHAGVAALPRAQEHPAHGALHRNGARSLQELLALTAVGAGKLGVASPSITLAFAPASRCASISLISSIERSICSVVMSLIALLCSTLCSRGTSRARILRYAAGCSHPWARWALFCPKLSLPAGN